jgi:hypothetical protein
MTVVLGIVDREEEFLTVDPPPVAQDQILPYILTAPELATNNPPPGVTLKHDGCSSMVHWALQTVHIGVVELTVEVPLEQ